MSYNGKEDSLLFLSFFENKFFFFVKDFADLIINSSLTRPSSVNKLDWNFWILIQKWFKITFIFSQPYRSFWSFSLNELLSLICELFPHALIIISWLIISILLYIHFVLKILRKVIFKWFWKIYILLNIFHFFLETCLLSR